MLLSALSWGRLCGDPVHNEVRPDVGAAIYSSVSPKEGHRLKRAVTKDRMFRALLIDPLVGPFATLRQL